MTAALASLLALLAAILVSCTSRINVGIVAIALAWAVGVYAELSAEAVLGGCPASLFITLAGVTLLFSLAESNGTIALVAHRLLRLARGRARTLPVIIFIIACAISTIGPGAIAAVALVAPLAMSVGARACIPPFLTALMVANGANAGNLSPLSAVGIIANSRMAAVGLGGHEWKVWGANFLAHAVVGVAAYMLLVRRIEGDAAAVAAPVEQASAAQRATLVVIAAWTAAVVVGRMPIGLAAFTAAVLLVLLRAADENDAFRRMPWNAIVMVCGVTMLVALVEKTGGMQLFTALLARWTTPATVNGVIAFVTGIISSYSSTSGVVLPTFLPTAPRLVEQVGGGDPLAVALSINVGASLVDVSPLSTLGALCVAALPDPSGAPDLFRKLLIWGLAMSLVGALLCLAFATPFARI